MNYNSLIEQNKQYKKEYEEYQKIFKEKRELLTKTNNEVLKNMDLEKLKYEELKELLDVVGYNVDDKIKEELNQIYLLRKPYTNTVINKMDFLMESARINLDLRLTRFKNKYINHSFWFKISLNKDVQSKIIDILLKEGLIKRKYKIHCPECGDYLDILNKEDIDLIKEFDDLKRKIKNIEEDTVSNKNELKMLYNRYYEIEEMQDSLRYKYCPECDTDNEFESVEDVLKYCKDVYLIE